MSEATLTTRSAVLARLARMQHAAATRANTITHGYSSHIGSVIGRAFSKVASLFHKIPWGRVTKVVTAADTVGILAVTKLLSWQTVAMTFLTNVRTYKEINRLILRANHVLIGVIGAATEHALTDTAQYRFVSFMDRCADNFYMAVTKILSNTIVLIGFAYAQRVFVVGLTVKVATALLAMFSITNPVVVVVALIGVAVLALRTLHHHSYNQWALRKSLVRFAHMNQYSTLGMVSIALVGFASGMAVAWPGTSLLMQEFDNYDEEQAASNSVVEEATPVAEETVTPEAVLKTERVYDTKRTQYLSYAYENPVQLGDLLRDMDSTVSVLWTNDQPMVITGRQILGACRTHEINLDRALSNLLKGVAVEDLGPAQHRAVALFSEKTGLTGDALIRAIKDRDKLVRV